jgi:hypothetical protein
MDVLVDAEPQNVREIISVQAVCLIFLQAVDGGSFAAGGLGGYFFNIRIVLTGWYECS